MTASTEGARQLRAQVDELARREADLRSARFDGSAWHWQTAERLRALRLEAERRLEHIQAGDAAAGPSLF